MNDFAKMLKEYREANDLTQKELSEETGIYQPYICDYENNKRQPSVDEVITLAEYFDISTDEMLGRAYYG